MLCARLCGIESRLGQGIERHLDEVRNSLHGLDLAADSPQAVAIARSIERRDIVTANELIGQARKDPLFFPSELPDQTILDEFFPDGAKAISEALESAASQQIVLGRVKRGESFGNLPINLPSARRESATRMLKAWFALKTRRRLDREGERLIESLFGEIGFVAPSVEAEDSAPNIALMNTVPLENRSQSPVPIYGSGARGRYRVICCWARPVVQDLMQYANQHASGPPPIVLFLGRLSGGQRTELANASRERVASLLVLDETVLLFLCGARRSRLPVLFQCTLPFTHTQPYVSRGGELPPEMFYGREKEKAAIRSPDGSCFIYGGRQLGKTAILRAVAAEENRPGEGHHAFFIDLKAHGIGVDRDAADIWRVLWETLSEARAIPEVVTGPSTKGRGQIEGFLNVLIRHFAPDSSRTLLVLLDEADRFLEVDSREQQPGVAASGFRESIRMKKLMDDTGRSIKIVFAGLHNVLRTAEEANHPLGQFGQPIEVGPLLHHGGMRAAWELVTGPLLAAGYRFELGDLVTRILAQTNYYPGLIQAYGAALVEVMRLKGAGGPPPYVVTEADLETTYREGRLAEFIRGRFHLTLELDRRYEVIAYSIAFLSTSSEDALVDGLASEEIYDWAVGSWHDGFAESSRERFRSLLDEMVGLGVLRRVAQERYSLRNPNVLRLLGTRERIEEKLDEKREPPQEFERETFRAWQNPAKPGDPERSPLTFQQAGRLFAEEDGIVLLAGTWAAGLEDLRYAFGSGRTNPVVGLGGARDLASFRSLLRRRVKAQQEQVRVYAVPPQAPWNRDWLGEAQSYLRSLRKADRHVRVLFLADGSRLLEIMRSSEAANPRGMEFLYLEPWRDSYLRQWLEDVGIANSAERREKILDVTGNWPEHLMRFHKLTHDAGDADAGLEGLDAELSDSGQREEYRRQLCLDDPATRAALRPLIYGALSREEVADNAADEGLSRDEVMLRLRWATRLGLVQQRLKWKINPAVGRLVGEQQGD